MDAIFIFFLNWIQLIQNGSTMGIGVWQKIWIEIIYQIDHNLSVLVDPIPTYQIQMNRTMLYIKP